VPLGSFNNLAALHVVDSTGKLALTTAVSTLPFAVVLAASAHFISVEYARWLLWRLWRAYIACAVGILRAWWIPYLGTPDPKRIERYRIRFAGTHGFLPVRNGVRPDMLHVAFHSLVVATLLFLAILTSRVAPHLSARTPHAVLR
jgi:hypothetical protein